MYNLADGRVMFVPPSVRDQLRKLEVKRSEPFRICKREVNDQGEPGIEWTVSRNQASQIPSAVQLIQSKLESAGLVVTGRSRLSNATGWQLCAGGEIVNVFDTGRVSVQGKNKARVRSILGLESTKGEIADGTSTVSPNNNGAPGHAGNETAPKKNGQPKLSYVMQMALQGALDATRAVEKYAEESGITDRNGDPFRFTNADIRAIGLSMFIEARKRAWGTCEVLIGLKEFVAAASGSWVDGDTGYRYLYHSPSSSSKKINHKGWNRSAICPG
jgi:hypothetical protein